MMWDCFLSPFPRLPSSKSLPNMPTKPMLVRCSLIKGLVSLSRGEHGLLRAPFGSVQERGRCEQATAPVKFKLVGSLVGPPFGWEIAEIILPSLQWRVRLEGACNRGRARIHRVVVGTCLL